MLPRLYPEKSFPPEYVLKDIGYVLELAQQTGVNTRVTELANSTMLQQLHMDGVGATFRL